MGLVLFLIFLALLYPIIAAWIVGRNSERRLAALEREVQTLRGALERLQSAPPRETAQAAEPRAPAMATSPPSTPAAAPTLAPTPAPAPPSWPPVAEAEAPAAARAPRASTTSAASIVSTAGAASAAAATPREDAGASTIPPRPAPIPRPEPTPPRWLTAAKTWLFTGNLVAKLGLVILFIGVAFLLKYVASTIVVPIELRLAGVVLADLALLGWGWRLRGTRREIGLPVQGTAIAILMLVVFGAYHRYALLPAAFAFALLVALTVFTCLLAALQNAQWLAAFGITGGFAVPLLLSTGQGNHIGLFSYYALLNAGVFALALKRSWRMLNLIGFAFTFVVGSAWGGLKYTPANYLSAQGFLILFFLFYVGIALAFARRQQTRLKDYVDAVLVLGTPLLGFGLQVGLVKDKPFGLAWSALALGAFYLVLATLLWRRGRERWRVLVETFAAIGVIFATLAIPFAVDGRWTSAAWALEGVGFVWFGLKRGQRRTWVFGMLLQLGAWIGFIGSAAGLDAQAAQQSNLWLGFLLLAGSAFAMARSFRSHADSAQPLLAKIANASIAIAALWLLAGAWTESLLRLHGSALANALAGGAILTTALLFLTGARLTWPFAARLAQAAQLAGAAAVVVISAWDWTWTAMFERDADKPLLGTAMIALAALATGFLLARAQPAQGGKKFSTAFLLWGGAWWFGPVLNIGAGRLVDLLPHAMGDVHERWTALYALAVVLFSIACAQLAARLRWEALRWLGAASWLMLMHVTLAALGVLYGAHVLPQAGVWLAWAILLAGGEYLLRLWNGREPALPRPLLQAVHLVRTAGPWAALWPLGAVLIERWLGAGEAMAGESGWAFDAAWGNYLPTWAMMGLLALLMRRSLAGGWPAAPLAHWYRAVLIPAGCALMLLLAAVWNLGQDGAMAPLPYLPLLNPLDLTTGFALLLGLQAVRLLADSPGNRALLLQRLRVAGVAAAYAWFNLILLRSAAHYLGIAYRWDELASSQFVQAMLSLVWSASALVLMRFAAQRGMRGSWKTGALLLGVVVLKLFAVDLANGGSMARVVSFVGVGLLMVLVGYLAPYPKAQAQPAPVQSA